MSSPEPIVEPLSPVRIGEILADNACLRQALQQQAEGAAEQMLDVIRLRRRNTELEQTNRDLANRCEALRDELATLKYRPDYE
jgi:cell division protein FtsB